MAMGGTRRRKTPKVAISGCARLSTVYPCPNNALRPKGTLPVWPIDPLPVAGSVLVEIYTSLAALEAQRSVSRSKIHTIADLNRALATLDSPPVAGDGAIDDHRSDALLAAAWLRKVADEPLRWRPRGLTPEIARTEGWTFGAL